MVQAHRTTTVSYFCRDCSPIDVHYEGRDALLWPLDAINTDRMYVCKIPLWHHRAPGKCAALIIYTGHGHNHNHVRRCFTSTWPK